MSYEIPELRSKTDCINMIINSVRRKKCKTNAEKRERLKTLLDLELNKSRMMAEQR